MPMPRRPARAPTAPDLDAQTRAYYRARAPEYLDWYYRGRLHARSPDADATWSGELAQLTAWLRSLTGARVFEVASGIGWWTRELAARNQMIGSDHAPEMLRDAWLADGPTARIPRCRADAYRLPIASGSFEACFFGFWFSHVPVARAGAFLREAARIVRPGGELRLIDSRLEEPNTRADAPTQTRRLSDGREFTIWKIYRSPQVLRELLGRVCRDVEVRETETHFVHARGSVV